MQPPVAASRGSANRDEEDDPDDDDDAPLAPPSYRGGGSNGGSAGRPDLRAYPSQPNEGYQPPSRYGSSPSATLTALFERTPYEFAPPAVQSDIVKRVQIYLSRSGFYDGPPSGNPGLRTTEAIANFQEVNRLRPTARLDVSTLGLMRLLPGRQTVEPRYDHPHRPRIIFEGRITE